MLPSRLLTLLLLVVAACTTVPPADPPPGCRTAFATLVRKYREAGLSPAAPIEQQPTGQLAVMSDGVTAMFLYFAYSQEIEQYLVAEAKWESLGACHGGDGGTYYLLRREVDLRPAEQEARAPGARGGDSK